MIEISNLTKNSYQLGIPILNQLCLKIKKNDSLSIIGMSNSGKSLLLKIIGLITLDYESGYLSFFNQDIKSLNSVKLNLLRKRIGIVFQNYTLFDSLTISENIGFSLRCHTNLSYHDIQKKIKNLLKDLNLASIENYYPYQISGGMKKRISIARSVIYNPEIILMDEPTAGLDPINANNVSLFIKNLIQAYNMTLISITNDIHYIRKISKHIAFLYEGNIKSIISIEDFYKQKNAFVNQFFLGKTKGPIKIKNSND